MPVSVAEYLGQRSDGPVQITPINRATKPKIPCPFRQGNCLKAQKGQHPVCSVRDGNGTAWIVCEHRLCATSPKDAELVESQKEVIRDVVQTLYGKNLADHEILIKREVSIPITETSSYAADYVIRQNMGGKVGTLDKSAILEMQGGGETAGTEKLTAHIDKWATKGNPTNEFLRELAGAETLETNAWRRQQEQFLVKGNVAVLTGSKIVFCVGSLLYDYLIQRLTSTNLTDLKHANWTLALIAFREDLSSSKLNPIRFVPDPDRTLFTNYTSFVQALTNQGLPQPQVFHGEFRTLDHQSVFV